MKTAGLQNTDTKNQIVGHLSTFIEFLKKEFGKLDTTIAGTSKSTDTDSAVLQALQQPQSSVNGLERKYQLIEAKIADVPKAYAEIVKSTIPVTRTPPSK